MSAKSYHWYYNVIRRFRVFSNSMKLELYLAKIDIKGIGKINLPLKCNDFLIIKLSKIWHIKLAKNSAAESFFI